MNANEFRDSLLKKIPLTDALGLEVLRFDARLTVLKAPHAPNRNHVNTVFGGSLYAVSALACYGLFSAISPESGVTSDDVVIQDGVIKYLRPVTGDFEVHAARPEEHRVRKFLDQVRRLGKGRLTLTASVRQDGDEKAVFEGTYVLAPGLHKR